MKGNGFGDAMFESFELGELSCVLFDCVSNEGFGDGLIVKGKRLVKRSRDQSIRRAMRVGLKFCRD